MRRVLVNKKPSVYGVGINDVPRALQCPKITSLWKGMLKRAYSKSYKDRNPTYKDCIVCEDWYTYSGFASWVQNKQYLGMELDKDILVPNNKVYCPEFCILVPHVVNTFINDRSKNGMLAGVSWCKQTEKYTARVSNPFSGVREHLGRSDNQELLHKKWKRRKYELSLILAEKFSLSEEISKAISARYK
ncbi:HNH endonuclease [Vibrio phage K460]